MKSKNIPPTSVDQDNKGSTMAEEPSVQEQKRCQLDSMGYVSLDKVLDAFSSPINEEQAWAVCYQVAQYLKNSWNQDPEKCYSLTGISSVKISQDGCVETVHGDTLAAVCTQHAIVNSLGAIIYNALDYGLDGNEERTLSQPLEELITCMTASEETLGEKSWQDDEGIGHDASDSDSDHPTFTLDDVVRSCATHIASPTKEVAGTHYKAVCRALVAESLELSTFLNKISSGKQALRQLSTDSNLEDSTLEEISFTDWARLWCQVMRQLREGVKLKKVTTDHNPIEYSLTPYEMLMDDIRSRRYKLRQVQANNGLPANVTKDAHSLILEFIRSRPPLVPAARRSLPPPPSEPSSPYDSLMRSIRQHDHQLRPVSPSATLTVETSRTKLEEGDNTPLTRRRLIKADISALIHDDPDDEDNIPLLTEDKSPVGPGWHVTVAHDLATCLPARTPERRHSITVCESPSSSPRSSISSLSISSEEDNLRPLPPDMKPNLDSLSLTMDEISHIRTVLTKAQLENIVNDKKLYEEVSKGKICFICRKVKFSLLGEWKNECKLCKRNICKKCSKKMRVPTEHFENIPVFALGPEMISSSSGSSGDDSPVKINKSATRCIIGQNNAWSAPNSPTSSRRARTRVGRKLERDQNHNSPAALTQAEKSQIMMKRSKTVTKAVRRNLFDGPLLTVCRDCKGIIVHVIKASNVAFAVNRRSPTSHFISLNKNAAIEQLRSNVTVTKKYRPVSDQLSPESMFNIKPL